MKLKKIWKIISTFLCIVLVVGLIGGSVALISKITTDKYKTVYLTYQNGDINVRGESLEENNAIYSNEFECKGLTITPNFDSKVAYTVFFYDSEGNFINKTNSSSDVFKENEVPTVAVRARIVLKFKSTVKNEDNKIGLLEKLDIQNDIKVEVFKNQNVKMPNIFEEDSTKIGYDLKNTVYNNSIHYSRSDGYNCSKLIDVSDYSQIKIVLHYNPETLNVYFVDSNNNLITYVRGTVSESGSAYETVIDIVNNSKYIVFDYNSTYNLPEVYPVA